ncbi:YncE family protein [Streptomyces sp. NPDC007157]|uniref:YncE family protein n=1 Tax=Streptomyces sp. NPDC007157 TaxID=3154681 RepID=UPI0034053DB4
MTTEDGSQAPRIMDESPSGDPRRRPMAATERVITDLPFERLCARARDKGLQVPSAPVQAEPAAAWQRKKIPVGDRPHSVAVNPDGTRLYVTNFGDGSVSVIDLGRESVVATHPVDEGPYGLTVGSDGTDLYVASPSQGTVTQYSISGDDVVEDGSILEAENHSKNPYGMAASPDGHVYVTLALSDAVRVTDKFLMDIRDIPAVNFPVGVAVSNDNTRVYATNYFAAGSVSVIDVSDQAVVGTIAVGNDPYGVAVSPDGTHLYVTHFLGPGDVSVIDVSTQTIVATVPVGDDARGVAVSPDGTRLYVTNFFANSVSVIDV